MNTLAAGTRLDRYVLGEVLGEGASARVYRARQATGGDEVAIKLFHARVGGPDDARRHREFTFLMHLHHPNLIELRDTGVVNGQEFLVMELVEGPTLQQRLREGPLPPEEVAALGADLGDALDYVHAHGITHRDVKPGNVLLGGRPRLTDFGIARIADAFWATEELVGTPAYFAPEQVLGEPVGPPADVYALGLVLLEALTGRREYPGSDADAAVARLHRPPWVPEGLPYGLSGLLTAMTAVEPFDRPGADEAAALLRDRGRPAGPVGPVSGTRRRLVAAGFTAAIGAAALGLAVLPGFGVETVRPVPVAESPGAAASPGAAVVVPGPREAPPAGTLPTLSLPGAGLPPEPVPLPGAGLPPLPGSRGLIEPVGVPAEPPAGLPTAGLPTAGLPIAGLPIAGPPAAGPRRLPAATPRPLPRQASRPVVKAPSKAPGAVQPQRRPTLDQSAGPAIDSLPGAAAATPSKIPETGAGGAHDSW